MSITTISGSSTRASVSYVDVEDARVAESLSVDDARVAESSYVDDASISALAQALRRAQEDIPCQTSDAELWFAESPIDVELAKSLCGSCPARVTCLEGALARREPWGVWGGELVVQGEIVARKRPRGRPRKNLAAR